LNVFALDLNTLNKERNNMSHWVDICDASDVVAGTGVCALLGDEQVAIFKVRKDNTVYAINNYDPIGKANVLSRGIIGSIGDEVVVASPLYKQHFSLASGQCVEDDTVSVKSYLVRIESGRIQLANR
jgi:nitrite reductase (NADH) small subunit